MRLSVEEIGLVDKLAAEWEVDRSKALRHLLREGIAACTRQKKHAVAAQRRATTANEENPREPEPTITPTRRPGHRRRLTPEEVRAAADRAERRSR
jgi:hypothetical protein